MAAAVAGTAIIKMIRLNLPNPVAANAVSKSAALLDTKKQSVWLYSVTSL